MFKGDCHEIPVYDLYRVVAGNNAGGAEAIAVSFALAEAEWEIKSGRKTTAWAQNGAIPGEVIIAREEDENRGDGLNRLPASRQTYTDMVVIE